MLDPDTGIYYKIRCRIQHYNPEKYWKRREEVVNNKSRVPKIIRLFWLFYIKKCDAFNNASLGTNLGGGCSYKEPPRFVHGLNGIIIGYNVEIGRNVTIHQQVTIANGTPENKTIIGDNVMIGKGATILPGRIVGNNVKIGANTCVTQDIPDNCTVVGQKERIIKKQNRGV